MDPPGEARDAHGDDTALTVLADLGIERQGVIGHYFITLIFLFTAWCFEGSGCLNFVWRPVWSLPELFISARVISTFEELGAIGEDPYAEIFMFSPGTVGI